MGAGAPHRSVQTVVLAPRDAGSVITAGSPRTSDGVTATRVGGTMRVGEP